MYSVRPDMLGDASFMALGVAFVLGVAIVCHLAYFFGQALGDLIRERRSAPRRREPEPRPPTAPPILMRPAPPGPLWANHRLWEDPAYRALAWNARQEVIIGRLPEIGRAASWLDYAPEEEPELVERFERGRARRI